MTDSPAIAAAEAPPPAEPAERPATIRHWRSAAEAPFAEPAFVLATHAPGADMSGATVVLVREGLDLAQAFIERRADRILFGDAAIADTGFIRRAAAALSPERVGVWIPARRMPVNWSLDLHSNADFRCLTPSVGKPSWEVLRADGAGSGIDVEWWIRQMLAQGATCALVSVDFADEKDHLIFAEIVEKAGEALWLAPRAQAVAEWNAEGWREFGNACQFALPPPVVPEGIVS